MTLDELPWEDGYNAKWGFAIVATSGQNVIVWRCLNTFYVNGNEYREGYYWIDSKPHGWWPNVDAITAQAIIYHLLGE